MIVVLLVVGGATPAVAQTWSHSEPGHDARGLRFDPDPQPCGSVTPVEDDHDREVEIRSESVTWGRLIRLKLHVEDLVQSSHSGATFHLLTDDADWFVGLAHVGGRVLTFVGEEPDYSQIHPDECGSYGISIVGGCEPAGQFRPRRDVVVVTIPPACLGNPRWVRAGGDLYSSVDEVDHVDVWAPAGTTVGRFRGPFGARVRPSVPYDEPVAAARGQGSATRAWIRDGRFISVS